MFVNTQVLKILGKLNPTSLSWPFEVPPKRPLIIGVFSFFLKHMFGEDCLLENEECLGCMFETGARMVEYVVILHKVGAVP